VENNPTWTRQSVPIKQHIDPVANSINLCGAQFAHDYYVYNRPVNGKPNVAASAQNSYSNGWSAAFARKIDWINLFIRVRAAQQSLQGGVPA
jgi:hypothetical protein